MTMRELKPCPLCGKKVSCYSMEVQSGHVTELEVWCADCLTTFKLVARYTKGIFKEKPVQYFPDGDALDVWNRRADNEQSQNSDC